MRQRQADLLIRNARLIDGSGQPARQGDLAIRDELICALGEPGELDELDVAQTLDANSKALAPGFIDVHTHDDNALLLAYRVCAAKSAKV